MTSEQNFVVADDKTKSFARDWGVLFLTMILASITGPIVVQVLQAIDTKLALIGVLLLTAMSLFFAIFATKRISRSSPREKVSRARELSLAKQLKLYQIFSLSFFPVMFLGAVLLFVEEMFWNFGALLGESLQLSENANWLVIICFSVPLLVGPVVLSRLGVRHHKKRLAMCAMILGGVALSAVYFVQGIVPLLLLIAATGVMLSFAVPLNEAVYSDLLERSKASKRYLLSLVRITASISYLLSPVLVGIMSDVLGYRASFAVVRVGVAVIASVLLLITPRKLRVPQGV